MTESLLRVLQMLGRIPGLGLLDDMANRIISSQHRARVQKDRVGEIREGANQLKRVSGDIVANKGNNDDGDKTVIRAPGTAMDQDRAALRPRPGGGGDGNKTVLRPRPGGRAAPAPAQVAHHQRVEIVGSGLNPLVDAATGLFTLVGQLRNTSSHPNVDALRNHVVQQIQAFDVSARNAGAGPPAMLAARYSLCTLIDETVLRTPWGTEGSWSQHSTLSVFHKETFGGEKFFQMLERASQEPASNLELLEFMSVCISLGLEGRYGVMEGGRSRLEQVQDNLFRTIRLQRGDFERELSPRWRGVEERGNRLARYVPLWVVAALASALLVAVYMGFTYSLAENSDAVFAELGQVGKTGRTALAVTPVEPVARTLTLREVLADDIQAGRVDVDELPGGTRVLIRGDGLFAPASATTTREVLPLLSRIGKALEQFPGGILVTGHTDSTPVSVRMKVRFPSNWHLSQARAESVTKLLAADLSDRSRLTAEGRGATEPVAGNETRENRARNRRVEITLLTPTKGSQ